MSEHLRPAVQPETMERPKSLGLGDSVSVIVGIVVGASIYKISPFVFQNVESVWMGLGLWTLGGVLSLIGAFCYAELATTYPRSGGDYVYLTRAFGPMVGFLFGWSHLCGILTGSIGTMAFVFAEYSCRLFGFGRENETALALSAVAGLTALNLLGVVLEKAAQNLLTMLKVVGLGAIIVSGVVWGGEPPMSGTGSIAGPGPKVAMILILYAFGGWNDAAFVAAEVRDPRRNIPRSLICGILGITLIYLLVNLAYLKALGFDGLRTSSAPAADALALLLGSRGERAMCLLVMVSTLGALNGLIFTGSRVHASLGADHRLFAKLGRWHPRLGTPAASLLAQAFVSLTLISLIGTSGGRSLIDRLLNAIGAGSLSWSKFQGGFDTLFAATAPIFWIFFLLTGLSLIVLRRKDGPIIRPFRVPFYPVTPMLFCLVCCGMIHSSLDYAGLLALLGLIPLSLGVPAYWISRSMGHAARAAKSADSSDRPGR